MSKRIGLLTLSVLGALFLLVGWSTVVRADNALPPDTSVGPCKPWVQVNDGAFGMGAGGDTGEEPYKSEEGFEVTVFNGQLYVGMEADNDCGARLWRTRSDVVVPGGQDDWEEVAAVNGKPFGLDNTAQNDHVDSLAVFNGVLYASTANRSNTLVTGTMLYSSDTGAPNSWTQVVTAGFGDPDNENFKDMVTFTVTETRWLCGGTSNDNGAEIWCTTDGVNWVLKNDNGFGSSANTLVASTGVFSEALYIGVVGSSQGSVWRTSDLETWTQVLTVTDRPRVEIVGVFSKTLYVAAGANDGRNASDPTIRIYQSGTGDPGSWQVLNTALDDDVNNTRTIVDGATVHNGALYLATMNAQTGAEVWRTTDGVNWTKVNSDGFGMTETFAAELIPFNGYLYAWASNYKAGQQVWRTACPIEQSITSVGTDTHHALPGVGAIMTFTDGAPDVVTVSVYPDAYPTVQTETLPIARHYAITYAPATAAFTADLTLSYTAEELAASAVQSKALRLTRWDESEHAWMTCPETRTTRNPRFRTVTCQDVTAFSTWAFSSTSGHPLTVHTVYLAAGTKGFHPLILGVISLLLGTLVFMKNKMRQIDLL